MNLEIIYNFDTTPAIYSIYSIPTSTTIMVNLSVTLTDLGTTGFLYVPKFELDLSGHEYGNYNIQYYNFEQTAMADIHTKVYTTSWLSSNYEWAITSDTYGGTSSFVTSTAGAVIPICVSNTGSGSERINIRKGATDSSTHYFNMNFVVNTIDGYHHGGGRNTGSNQITKIRFLGVVPHIS